MERQPICTVSSQSKAAATAPEPSPPALPILRFGLRQLFWTVTGLSLLLAAMAASPQGPSALLLLIAVLIIAAHITGTAIGSRLCRHAEDTREWATQHAPVSNSAPDVAEHSCEPSNAPLPPTSPWYQRGSTAMRWLPKVVIAGAFVGGCGGVALFAFDSISHTASPAGILVGAISVAILGAWIAFLGGSFYAIFRHGLREAMAHQRRDESHIIVRR
jgi:hypothetical protein